MIGARTPSLFWHFYHPNVTHIEVPFSKAKAQNDAAILLSFVYLKAFEFRDNLVDNSFLVLDNANPKTRNLLPSTQYCCTSPVSPIDNQETATGTYFEVTSMACDNWTKKLPGSPQSMVVCGLRWYRIRSSRFVGIIC